VLRAWRSDAGELLEERRAGLGDGGVRDESGAITLMVGPALFYVTHGRDIAALAENARHGIATSQYLRNALWLNGRTNRTAADYYMVHEYASREFGGEKGIRDHLGVPVKAQKRLTKATNNLSPLAGGRHAIGEEADLISLDEQRLFISELLRLWMKRFPPAAT